MGVESHAPIWQNHILRFYFLALRGGLRLPKRLVCAVVVMGRRLAANQIRIFRPKASSVDRLWGRRLDQCLYPLLQRDDSQSHSYPPAAFAWPSTTKNVIGIELRPQHIHFSQTR